MSLSTQDMQDLDDLNRASRGSYGGGSNGTVSDFDFTEAAKAGTIWPVGDDGKGIYAMRSIRAENKVGKERYDEKTATMVGGNPYVEIEFECFAGPMKGETIVDRFPKRGKGTAKMIIFGSAIGIWDKEAERLTIQSTEDLVGHEVWATIVIEKGEYKGRPTEKSVIAFDGYASIDTYELPEDAGFGEEFNAADASDDASTNAFLATTVTEEVEEEVVEEVAPAARPVRARAGAAGGQPPWPIKK